MKLAVLCSLLIATVAAPAIGQTAPAPAAPAAGSTATTGAKFTLDTPIQDLVADEQANAALKTAMGADITQNPFYEQIKAMSFNQVQPISNGQLTDETMKKIADALAAIK